MKPYCYSIGHSNYSWARLLDMMNYHGITAVADVRSVPYSRFVPQYNREALAIALPNHGIKYWYAGNKLGGMERRELDLDAVIQGRDFQSGLDAVEDKIAGGETLALMCAEKDPFDCHRFYLISYALENRGIEVRHILESGNAVPSGILEDRLVDVYHDGLFQLSLFEEKDCRDATRRAYSRRYREQAFCNIFP